ncbi:hypothetical protein HU200_025541 [Digitaria exilis]|uniref:Uncharacterized protein n=1 Tax=Digitaria exilis TaxID=1010633 RepID=A0A835C0Q6_9POAL|nr:hypothetical protein HU200_025541 [Digitaria exilis]
MFATIIWARVVSLFAGCLPVRPSI